MQSVRQLCSFRRRRFAHTLQQRSGRRRRRRTALALRLPLAAYSSQLTVGRRRSDQSQSQSQSRQWSSPSPSSSGDAVHRLCVRKRSTHKPNGSLSRSLAPSSESQRRKPTDRYTVLALPTQLTTHFSLSLYLSYGRRLYPFSSLEMVCELQQRDRDKKNQIEFYLRLFVWLLSKSSEAFSLSLSLRLSVYPSQSLSTSLPLSSSAFSFCLELGGRCATAKAASNSLAPFPFPFPLPLLSLFLSLSHANYCPPLDSPIFTCARRRPRSKLSNRSIEMYRNFAFESAPLKSTCLNLRALRGKVR